MAKKLTKTNQEALGLVSNCKILAEPIITPAGSGTAAVISMLLEDPVGQKFLIQYKISAALGLSGNVMLLNCSVGEIAAFELEQGDNFREFTF